VSRRLCLRTLCNDRRTISPTQYIRIAESTSFASGFPTPVIEGPISRVNLWETKWLTTISEGTKAGSIAAGEVQYLLEMELCLLSNDGETPV